MALEAPAPGGCAVDLIFAIAIAWRRHDRQALGDPAFHDLCRDAKHKGDARLGHDLAQRLGGFGRCLTHWRAPLGKLESAESRRASRPYCLRIRTGPGRV